MIQLFLYIEGKTPEIPLENLDTQQNTTQLFISQKVTGMPIISRLVGQFHNFFRENVVILVNIQIARGMFCPIYMFTFLVSSNHWVLAPMHVSRVVVCTIASLRILPAAHHFALDDHSLAIVDRFPVMRSFPLQRMKILSFQHWYTMILSSQTSKKKKGVKFFIYWITIVDFSHPDFECEPPSPSLWRCSDFICSICIFISTICQQYGEILIYIYM